MLEILLVIGRKMSQVSKKCEPPAVLIRNENLGSIFFQKGDGDSEDIKSPQCDLVI